MSDLLKNGGVIAGAGGGGKSGGSGSSTPTEDADSLRSKSMVSLLDLISEGQIGGLVDGGRSIFFGDDYTPLMNADGSYNYSGVTWEFRNGTQDQRPITGFDQVSTPVNVNQEIKQLTPKTVSIDNDSADQVKFIIQFPKMTTTDLSTGDTHGSKVQFKFQMAYVGKNFADVAPDGRDSSLITVEGKRSSRYYESYTFTLPKPAKQYRFKLIRVSNDSTSDYVQNSIILDSYYELVDSKLSYPNSALFGIKIDSTQFNQIPSRAFLIDGLIIRVPSNYNIASNEYVGTWDGSFQLAVSSNPAWILFDIMTNKRYGLGQYVDESLMPIGKLYQIGRYCDQEVPDGFNGTEKRFSINTVINSRVDAYKVIQDIASAFRGMIFWSGGMVNVTQDSPEDPTMLYSNSNVINGEFLKAGTARKDRHSVALITYNDPDDNYRQAVEYVEDPEAIELFGVRKTESIAFGCVSRGQAHRVGLWTLYSERMESDMITFEVGLDSAFVMPGQIVKIQDRYTSGRRMSGRLVATSKASITLDQEIELAGGKGDNWISVMMPDGTFADRLVSQVGTVKTINFGSNPLPDVPVDNAVWTVTQPDLVPLLARVLEIKQGDDGTTFKIAAIQHNPSKFSAIENGTSLEIPKTSVLDPTFSIPENLRIDEATYLASPGNLASKLIASWEGRSSTYVVRHRRADKNENWKEERVFAEEFELLNVQADGVYDFEIYSISTTGRASEKIAASYKVLGTGNPPGVITNLTAVGDYRSILLNWSNPSNLDLDHTEIWVSDRNDSTTAKVVARQSGTNWTHGGLDDDVELFYWAKAVNKRNMAGQFNSNMGTNARTKDVLSFLLHKITNSELSKELNADIDNKATKEELEAAKIGLDNADAALQGKINDVQGEVDTVSANLDTAKKNLQTNIDKNAADIKQAKSDLDSADAALGKRIDTADKNLTTAVTDMNGKVDATNDALTKAKTDLAAADTALDGKVKATNDALAKAKTDLAAADTALDGKIAAANTALDKAKTELQAADNALDEKVASVDGRVTATNAALTKAQADLQAADTALGDRITQAQQNIDDAVNNTSESIANARDDLDRLAEAAINNSIALDKESQERKAHDGRITEAQKVIINDQQVVAEKVVQIDAKFDQQAAKIVTLQKTVADADSALSQQVQTLDAKTTTALGDVNTSIKNVQDVQATVNYALTQNIQGLDSKFTGALNTTNANITTLQKTVADGNQALATQIQGLTAKTNDNTAAITSEATTRATADTALSTRIDSVRSDMVTGDAKLSSSIDSLSETVATATEALTHKTDTMQSSIDSVAAGVVENSIAQDKNKQKQDAINASIINDQKTIANEQSATASSLNVLTAQYQGTKSQLKNLEEVVATADQALSTRLATAESKIGDNTAAIQTESQTRASQDSALSYRIDTVKADTEQNSAAIVTLQKTIADGDQAIATQVTNLTTRMGKNETAISNEATARSDADSALGTRIDSVKATTDKNTASIQTETTARTTADTALSTRIDSVKSTTDGNTAAINAETTARTTADTALSTRIDSVKAATDQNTAGLTAETKARTTADSALASQITSLESKTDAADAALSADITSLAETVTTNEKAAASRSDTMKAQLDSVAAGVVENSLANDKSQQQQRAVNAQIINDQKVLVTKQEATATKVELLQSNFDSSSAELKSLKETTATANTALSKRVDSTESKVADVAAAVLTETGARASQNAGLSYRIDTLKTQTDAATADITTLQKTVTDGDSALATQISGLNTKVADNTAAITSEATARANADTALSTRVDSVKAATDKNTASIATETTARTTADTALSTRIDSVKSATETAAAAITAESTTRANADSALSARVDSVKATADKATSDITTLKKTVADGDQALATQITGLSSKLDDNTAAITSEATTRANADSALSTRVDSVKAATDKNTAGLTTEQTARASADTALTQQITSLRSDMNTGDANISSQVDSLSKAVSTQNDAMAERTDNLKAQIDATAAGLVDATVAQDKSQQQQRAISAQITNDQKVMADTQSAQASTLSRLLANFKDTAASLQTLSEVAAASDLALTRRLISAESSLNDNAAAIKSEAVTRAENDQSLSSQIDVVRSSTAKANADITTLKQTVTDGDSALAQQIATTNANVGKNSTAIQAETTARTTADSALGTRIDSVKATADKATANIATETTARANADTALSQKMDTMKSELTNADTALSSDITTLTKTVTENNAASSAIEQQLKAQADAAAAASVNNTIGQDEADRERRKSVAILTNKQEATASDVLAQSQRLAVLSSTFDKMSANITELSKVMSNADETLATQITGLKAEFKKSTDDLAASVSASMQSERSARVSQEEALSTRIDTLSASNDKNTASIQSEATARATADSALSTRVDAVKSTSDKATADIITLQKAVTTADSALSTRLDGLNSRLGTAESGITSEATTRASADTALGKRVDTVSASTDKVNAQVQTISQAQADQTSKLNAMWAVKMNVNVDGQSYIAGMGVGLENYDGKVISQFLVQADRMALVNATNGTLSTPFVVDGGKTYINSAYIKEASIGNAQITGDLWSSNYDWATGQRGWLLGRSGYLTVGSEGSGGGRMRIEGHKITVFDGNGVLRVQIGNLD